MRLSAYVALISAVFAVAFGYSAIMPLLPEFVGARLPGALASEVARHAGGLTAAYMAALVVLSPVWGTVSDRHGARPVILIGLIGSALVLVAGVFAESLLTAYAARAAQGAFAAAILPVATAALAGVADTAERARKVAGLSAVALLGYFAGPALSAAILAARAAQPVAVVLLASAILAGCASAIVATSVARGAPGVAGQGELLRVLPARFLALNLLVYFGLGAFEVALPLAAPGAFAGDAARVSVLFMQCSLVMLAVQGALMWAAPFRSRFPQALIAGIAVFGSGLVLLAVAGSLGSAAVAVALIAAGSGLVLPLVGFLATLEIRARPGAALGGLAAAGGLGQALGAAAGGFLYGYAGQGMFAATAIVAALSAWLASPACAPRWLGGGNDCSRT